MPAPTWFAALLDEIVPLILARPIRKLQWVRLARNGPTSQYDVIFRTRTGSGGHANVYLIKTVSNGTLIITGQVADRSEGVQVLENDHDVAFAFGRGWLIRVGHLSAAMGELHHFTANLDTGELRPIRRAAIRLLWSASGQRLRAANDDLAQSFACHFDWSTCTIFPPTQFVIMISCALIRRPRQTQLTCKI